MKLDKKYSCLVIDPPWYYRLRKNDATHRNRIPYPPMQTIEGVSNAIEYFHQRNYLIVGATNQAGVAAGYKTLEECIQEQRQTIALCPSILKIYFCPDFEGKEIGCVYSDGGRILNLDCSSEDPDIPNLPTLEYDSFRKPGSGMIRYILDTHDVNPAESIYVGDRQEDRDCIKEINCSFLWADFWRSSFGGGN